MGQTKFQNYFCVRWRILYKRQENKIPSVEKKWSDDWRNGKEFCRIIRVLSLDEQFRTSLLSSMCDHSILYKMKITEAACFI